MADRVRLHRGNLAGACLVAGVIALASGAWGIVAGLATTRWASVAGTVVDSHVVPVGRAGPDEASITYRYAVQGRALEGNRVGYYRLTTQRGANRFVADRPAGSAVTVYYDPNDPSRAALVQGVSLAAVVAFASGVAMLAGWRIQSRGIADDR